LSSSYQAIVAIQDAIYKGAFKQALEEIKAIKSDSAIEDKIKLKAEILETICNLRLGFVKQAYKKISDLLIICRKSNDKILVLHSLLALSEICLCNGLYDDGIEKIREAETIILILENQNEEEIEIIKAKLILFKGELLGEKGELEKAIELILKSKQMFEIQNNNYGRGRALCKLSSIYRRQGKIEDAERCIEVSSKIFEKIGNKQEIAYCLNNRASNLQFKGKQEEALKLYESALSLFEEIGNKQNEAMVLNNIAVIYHDRGDLDEALKYLTKSMEIHRKLENKSDLAINLNNMGWLYQRKGELNRALSFLKESLTIFQEVGNKQYEAYTLHNIGKIFYEKGELDFALDYYERSLALFEDIGNILNQGIILTRFGKINLDKDKLEHAKKYLLKSLEFFSEIENNIEKSLSLFLLVQTSLAMGKQDEAERYYNDLQKINKLEKNLLIDQRARIARALILMHFSRMKGKIEAQDILESIQREDIIDHELTTFALINSITMLLEELEFTEAEEILTELETKINNLLAIGKEQNSFKLLAKAYWAKSQLALLKSNIKEAKYFLNQAQLIAEEKGLQRYAIKMSAEFDQLLNKLNKWEELIKEKASLRERINYSNLEEKTAQIMQKEELDLPELENEEPVLLIMVEKNGNTLFSKKFTKEKELNEYLIGGFLSAINTFMQEAFSSEGYIERIKHNEFNLIIKPKDLFLFSYVYKGQSYKAIKKLNSFIHELEKSSAIWDKLIGVAKYARQLDRNTIQSIETTSETIFTL